jgi:hypothetical protein
MNEPYEIAMLVASVIFSALVLLFFYIVVFDKKQTQEIHMDKKIKKVLSKEKGAVKETKELLKMDKKHDKKMEKCKMSMKKK